MAKRLNHHLYQDRTSGVWYFQKKVRGTGKSYKFSLETKSVVEARRKRDSYLKQIDIHGCIPKSDSEDVSESLLFGEVAQKWAKIAKSLKLTIKLPVKSQSSVLPSSIYKGPIRIVETNVRLIAVR